MGIRELQKKHVGLMAKGASVNFVFSRWLRLLKEVKDFMKLLEEEKKKKRVYGLKERTKMATWWNFWYNKTRHLGI